MQRIKSKKGQVTIWVIIAILLVGSMILFFTIEQRPNIITGGNDFSPETFIDSCVRDEVNEATEIMIPQGGFIEPSNYKLFKNTKVEYLCQNTGNYAPCINQHPAYVNELGDEIKNKINSGVEECFQNLKTEVEERRRDISLGVMSLSVDLAPENVKVKIEREVKISRGSEISNFEEFEIDVVNPTYDLAFIAIEIASQEAKYCSFEYVGYSVLYPRFDIRRETVDGGTKIYTIKDKKTSKEMNIAIKGCTIPPGI